MFHEVKGLIPLRYINYQEWDLPFRGWCPCDLVGDAVPDVSVRSEEGAGSVEVRVKPM